MKGIILAGGRGTRLSPITDVISKQLLPVYNKPMIYYPLSILMLSGIREIMVITTPEDLPVFRRLLGDGDQWGISFQYCEQDEPRGLADAFIIGRDFIAGEPVCLILGDNIFFGHNIVEKLKIGTALIEGGLIFAYPVQDPQRYGVVEFDNKGKVIDIEEKPITPRSNYAVPGLYFYDGKVSDLASTLSPSARGELEITDLNRLYIAKGQLHVEKLGRGIAWLDAGTYTSLLQAAIFIQAVEERQGLMISSPEEIAFRHGYIDTKQLQKLAEKLENNNYGVYLKKLLDERF